MKTMISQSFNDLRDDFVELAYLAKTTVDKLTAFLSQLNKQKKHILPETLKHAEEDARHFLDLYQTIQNRARDSEHQARLYNKTDLTGLRQQKLVLFDLIRSQITMVGALLTCTDWQSPSFLHATHSMAGVQEGKIIHTINDYKRDQHLDEKQFEQDFLHEYIDGIFKLPVHVLAVQSGMAAFTTVLNFLSMERKVKNKILIGSSIYFENKDLVRKLFPDQIIEVSESATSEIIEIVRQQKPSVIIFDSLCNAQNVPMPDLPSIIAALIASVREDTYLVIDNTCLSVMLQPFKLLLGKTTKVHLIVIESLNKYHQFGMDRITGGIIWSYGKDTGKLFDYRVHLGTNISDILVHALPKPNRDLLERRLRRFERNASYLVSALQGWIYNHPKSAVAAIHYPQLTAAKFHGSYFVVAFKTRYQTVSTYRRFVQNVINEAKKRNVDIVSGSSFGLNTTRIYVTAVRATFGKPFLRVAVGTEDILTMEKIKEVFLKVMQAL